MTKEYFNDDLVITPQKGYGIRFGTLNSAQNFGWRDITGQVTVKAWVLMTPTGRR